MSNRFEQPVPHRIQSVKTTLVSGEVVFSLVANYKLGDKWKLKRIPVAIQNENEAHAFFCDWFLKENNPPNALVPSITSIRSLYSEWLQYKKNVEHVDVRISNEIESVFKNWILNHTISDMNIDVADIQPSVFQEWINHIDRAPLTVRNIVKCLRTFFGDVRGLRKIQLPYNPLREDFIREFIKRTKPASTIAGEGNAIVFSIDQIKTLLNCSKINNFRKTRYIIAVCTGMRDAEIQGLKWKDIDLVMNTVKVDRQLVRYTEKKEVSFKAPKKGRAKAAIASYRTIPLHSKASKALEEWRASYSSWCGKEPEGELAVFPNEGGEHFFFASSRYLQTDLKRAKLPLLFQDNAATPFVFKSLRATFATALEEAGVSESKVSRLLGHAGKDVKARHYIGKSLSIYAEAIAKLPL